jgi:hypothetical protein
MLFCILWLIPKNVSLVKRKKGINATYLEVQRRRNVRLSAPSIRAVHGLADIKEVLLPAQKIEETLFGVLYMSLSGLHGLFEITLDQQFYDLEMLTVGPCDPVCKKDIRPLEAAHFIGDGAQHLFQGLIAAYPGDLFVELAGLFENAGGRLF